MYGSKLPSQSFTTTQLEAQRTTCMALGKDISERAATFPGDTYRARRGGKQVKSHQDVQQYQALAPGCPLPEVYGVLEFADGCKGNLERHHIF